METFKYSGANLFFIKFINDYSWIEVNELSINSSYFKLSYPDVLKSIYCYLHSVNNNQVKLYRPLGQLEIQIVISEKRYDCMYSCFLVF